MIDNPITAITADDIRRLVDEGTPERRTLEFKRELPGNSDSAKKEFLADVSSFANAVGGDLIYGVAETNGQATAADGLTLTDVDAALLRLDQMIRSGISPRIVGFQIQRVDGLTNGPAIVIRIPRSYQGPHIVSYQQYFRYFGRNAAGKFPMDGTDIRDAVLNAGSTEERIRLFRADRLARIAAGETPAPLAAYKLIVIHVVPFAAFGTSNQIDLKVAAAAHRSFEPFYSGGWSAPTFNLDGVHTSTASGATADGYVQLFRNGIVEAVDAAMIPSPSRDYPDAIPSQAFPEHLFKFVGRVMDLYGLLRVEPPYAVLVSFLGAKGVHLGIDTWRFRVQLRPFDRDVVMLPEVIIDSRQFDPDVPLRPVLDALWQAFGASECWEYSEAGRWSPRRR